MRWLVALLALAACQKTDRLYCPMHMDDTEHCPPDGGTGCASSDDCPGEVCDLAADPPHCAQCTTTELAACTQTTPICVDDRCVACHTDDDCADGVCMPDGSCPAASQIIYASVTGATAGACGDRAMPCGIARAVTLVTPALSIIKMIPDASDYTVAGGPGLAIDKTVTIDARGATLRKTSNGAVITVSAGSLTLLGGLVTGGMGGGDGIVCTSATLTLLDTDVGANTKNGIEDTDCVTTLTSAKLHDNPVLGLLKNGGTLTMSRSTVQTNAGGGLYVLGTTTRFTIIGNAFWMNGGSTSAVGGATVATNTGSLSRFEFNSFNANQAGLPHGNAFECMVAGFNPKNNVMFGNTNAVSGSMDQFSGSGCVHTYSIAAPGVALTDVGDSAMDPQFKSAATGNLHTLAGSPTEHAADPMTDLSGAAALDIDGDPRKATADIGADQH